MIDVNADATLDPQFIHIDPVRAAAIPIDDTVAHGFPTLSLLPHFLAMLQERFAPTNTLAIIMGWTGCGSSAR